MNHSQGWQDGPRIRQIRKERGFARGEFAAKVGLRQAASLSNIEYGNKPASLEVLLKIAAGLGVNILEIIKPDAPWRDDLARIGNSGAA